MESDNPVINLSSNDYSQTIINTDRFSQITTDDKRTDLILNGGDLTITPTGFTDSEIINLVSKNNNSRKVVFGMTTGFYSGLSYMLISNGIQFNIMILGSISDIPDRGLIGCCGKLSGNSINWEENNINR